MTTLKSGQVLRGRSSGLACTIGELLGEGGQGSVYSVRLDERTYALKWYNDLVLRLDVGLRRRLQVAVDRGAPSEKFLWPFELTTLSDGSRLGYLMRLRKPGLEGLIRLLAGELETSFRVIATASCLISDALIALHSKGLVYQDLNPGGIFFDPRTGDIEICDNDNVDVDGAPSIMAGQCEYQAPEIVLRRSGPTRATDLHSLAVLLFRVLHLGHPLRGRRELDFPNLADEAAVRSLYALEARFVFDPDDESNRPVPGEHDPVIAHWALYPQFLRELFIQAFTAGLHDPVHGRVQGSDWRRAMSQLRDSLTTCPHCRAESFYDAKRVSAKQLNFSCWRCDGAIPSGPRRLGIWRPHGRSTEPPAHVVVLEAGARLFRHHTLGSDYDFDSPSGEVLPDAVGLRNISNEIWTSTNGGSTTTVLPGDTLTLAPGLRIGFPGAIGGVKA